jgi:hypothetical protein
MYAKEVISLVLGTVGVLLVPAVIWSWPSIDRLRRDRNKRQG